MTRLFTRYAQPFTLTSARRTTPRQKGPWLIGATLLLLMLLAGCATPPLNAPSVPDSSTDVSTDISTATPQPETVAPTQAQRQRAINALTADVLLRAEGSSDPGFDGARLFPVEEAMLPADAPDLWVAHTTGIRPFDPLQPHFVALLTFGPSGFEEIARHQLECSDILMEGSVTPVKIEPDGLWLEVWGGAGAHGGCLHVLRYDPQNDAQSGEGFVEAASGFSGSPDAGQVEDLDGDGWGEVILNQTDHYVFCYACGVRLYNAEILRWTGDELASVTLQTLPAEAPATLSLANDQAVALAQAELYNQASPLINEALALTPPTGPIHDIVRWNQIVINRHAEIRRLYAPDGGYPLLSWVFYGDYEAAVKEMRPYPPEEIFSLDGRLITESAAFGWTDALTNYLDTFTEKALSLQPDLAPAHFLQGWGRYLADPESDEVLPTIQRAADLAPQDPLYQASVAYLTGAGSREPTALKPTPSPTPTLVPTPTQITPVNRVRFGSGETVYPIAGDFSQRQGFVLGLSRGQTLYVHGPSLALNLTGPEGNAVTSERASDTVAFAIPSSGDYTLTVQGQGEQIILYVPPLQPGRQPVESETVRFAPGGTSTTLTVSLRAGRPQGYRLGIQAGQRMDVTVVSGDADFNVLDPAGQALTAFQGRTVRSATYLIPRSGPYTLVLEGSGDSEVTISIPPIQ